MESTNIALPASTIFPVEVTAILKGAGDEIEKFAPILTFKYWHEVEDNIGEETNVFPKPPPTMVRKEFFSNFESPVKGQIDSWNIKVGDMIDSADQIVAAVQEPCTHAVQYGGMCAWCGASVADEKDYTDFSNKDRAPISMSHSTAGLTVSLSEAQRLEEGSTKQLLKQRKLILVVDLDQTVIHVTVDPTVGEWKKDPSNPNYDAVKDVRVFSLEEMTMVSYDGGKPVPQLCYYYVKLRPHLKEFLEVVSEKYELHIYTMATRAYAKAIAEIIDPDGRYFGDRILSRDESGSLTQKSLQRLFPVDTSMVAIIDDRGDVWKWSKNLIRVVPYDFFVGIGDINSSFLPQRAGMVTPNKVPGKDDKIEELDDNKEEAEGDKPATEGNGTEEGKGKEIDNGESDEDSDMKQEENKEAEKEQDSKEGETGDSDTTHEAVKPSAAPAEKASPVANMLSLNKALPAAEDERKCSIEAQQKDRPLAKLQSDLDSASSSEDESHEERHHLLVDNDNELVHVQEALIKLHEDYYKDYDDHMKHHEDILPDVQDILSSLTYPVFGGCVFLFSGIIPIGVNIQHADISMWVKKFGATVVEDVSKQVTHVIAASGNTRKVRQASRYKRIKFVYISWIFDCISQWKRVPVEGHEIPQQEINENGFSDGGEHVDDDDDDDDDDMGVAQPFSLSNMDWGDELGTSDDDDDDDDDADNADDESSNKRSHDDDDDTDGNIKRPKTADDNDGEGEGEGDDDFAAQLEADLLDM
ncbi:RNA polymerase II subunit A C-terminal domain phosphatase [Yarrowia sp. E02]|nr:RNA polymerase II subunit A C-terminal domain phosphatase [Yarrowia sp. E02]